MKKTTVEEARIILNYANQLKNHKSPFGYACLRNSESLTSALKPFNKSLEAKKAELALVDKEGCYVLNDKGNQKFTKKNTLELEVFFEEQNKLELEYENYMTTDISAVKTDLTLLNAINGHIVDVDIESLYKENVK